MRSATRGSVDAVCCGLLEQAGYWHVEASGQRVQRVQRRVPPSALDAGDIRPVQPTAFGEVFLRPAVSQSQRAHSIPERAPVGGGVEGDHAREGNPCRAGRSVDDE